jgi:hypothetical protein
MSSNPSPENLLFTGGRAAVYAEKQEKSQAFDIHNYKRLRRLAYRRIGKNPFEIKTKSY